MSNTTYQDMIQKQIEMVGNNMLSPNGQIPEIGQQLIAAKTGSLRLWIRGGFSLGAASVIMAFVCVLSGGLVPYLSIVWILAAIVFALQWLDGKSDLIRIEKSPKMYVLDQLRERL